jgi:hypothetical protein
MLQLFSSWFWQRCFDGRYITTEKHCSTDIGKYLMYRKHVCACISVIHRDEYSKKSVFMNDPGAGKTFLCV